MRKKIFFFILIIALAVWVRLYELDSIPGEWYGDISIIHNYVKNILEGNWPLSFVLSAGPLYQYLISPLIWFLGYTYLSYKLASVVLSIGAILVTMFMAREVKGIRLSLVTGLTMAISSWFLVFSRLGNLFPLVVLLTAGSGLFLLRAIERQSYKNAAIGGVISSLGLYVYPQTFVLPGVYLVLIAVFGRGDWIRRTAMIMCSLIVIVICSVPFVREFEAHPENFHSGYVGNKLFASNGFSWQKDTVQLARNIGKTMGMFFTQGDVVFRSNPPKTSHIDHLSAILLLAGILGLALTGKYRVLTVFICFIIFLCIPSSWPFLPEGEIPSASRTVGVTPFIYLLVAYGIVFFYEIAKKLSIPKSICAVGSVLLFAAILIPNLNRYFITYASSLPNHNVPYGRMIASRINSMGAVQPFVLGCCWGEWGQPEPDSIRYSIHLTSNPVFLERKRFNCPDMSIQNGVPVFFFAPHDEQSITLVSSCLPGGSYETVNGPDGKPVYTLYIFN